MINLRKVDLLTVRKTSLFRSLNSKLTTKQRLSLTKVAAGKRRKLDDIKTISSVVLKTPRLSLKLPRNAMPQRSANKHGKLPGRRQLSLREELAG